MTADHPSVTRAAGIVGTATLLSRIFGFVRDVVIAGFFGAGMAADAFFVAFRIPNLLRRLFAEGSLTIAFVPVFTEYISHRGRPEAFRLARSAVRLLSVLLAAASVAGILLAPWIIHVIAPGFMALPPKYALTVALTRFMFPYIFFIGLMALCMGILNVLGHFAAPALAPVLLNLSMIAGVVFLSPHLERPVYGLAAGVLAGGLLQLVLQIPFLIRLGFHFWKAAPLMHPGLKRIGRLMVPAIFGAAVYQINILVGTLLASLLPAGSVSYLYYADRLVQFPLGIFAIATATAVLPSLSRHAANRNMEALRATFAQAMNLVFFITVPAMVGLIVLRVPIVSLLFGRGAFDLATVHLTASALLFYGVGLWAFSAVRIVVSLFYALQDTRTPVKTAVVSIAANIVLSLVLMGRLRHGGLALATSLASMVNLALLCVYLRRRLGTLKSTGMGRSLVRTTVCSLLMGLVVAAAARYLIPAPDAASGRLLFGVAAAIFAGVATYLLLAWRLKSPELRDVLKIRSKRGKESG